jgi:hypothetical protein
MGLDDNSKTYLRQMDADELGKDLWPRLKKGGELFIWKQGQADPYSVKPVYGAFESSGFSALPIEVERSYLDILKSTFRQTPIFLKFKFSADLQYFTSGVIDWSDDQGKFVVKLTGAFFVTTKRAACRYVVSTTDRIHVSMAGHSFSVFDISSGGFSAMVDTNKYGTMEKGTSFEQVELKYNLKKFTIPKVTLVNIIEDKNDSSGRVKLAFKFEGLKVALEDSIWVEVNKSVQRLAQLLG